MTSQEWKTTPAIESEVNTLMVVNSGNTTSLVINDVAVEQYERIKYDGSYCCVTGVNKSNELCSFDAANLSVSELVDPQNISGEYLPKQSSNGGWASSGSGFFISEDGLLATNYHVVEDADVIQVSIVREGEWKHYSAKVVLSDKQNDLSIVKIEDKSFSRLPSLPYNFSTTIKDTGSEVFTLGYPIADIMGDEVKFTDGKISSKTGIQGDVTVYQISVPIQPGNSGGPLFDDKGSVVGITSSGLESYAQSYTLNEQWVPCGDSCELLDPYYSEGVSFEWSGGSKDGKAHGIGKAIKYVHGKYESTYEGEYKNGVREGRGKFIHSDGSVMEGSFVNGQFTGEGKVTTEDGHSYIGHFVNYRRHGVGKIKMANGSSFEGWFVADNPYTGKWTNYDGTVFYLQEGEPVEKIVEKQKSNYKPKIGKRLTEYFDKEWNRCQAKDAAFYRLITYEAPNKPKGIIKDYYISGEPQGDFTAVYMDYEDEGKNFFEGEANWYYKSGKLEKKCYFYNSKLNGPEVSYYEDGTIHSTINYNNGVLDGSSVVNYPNGSPQVIANYDKGTLKNNKYLHITEEGMAFLVYDENFIRNRESWEYKGPNGKLDVNSDNSISLQITPSRTVSGGIYTGFSTVGDNIISIMTHRKAS